MEVDESGNDGLMELKVEAEPVPRCLNCLAVVDPLQHYCHECGDPVGQLTPFIPFVNVRWEALIWGRMWKRAIGEDGAGWGLRMFYWLMIVWCVPVLLLALPFYLIASKRSGNSKDESDIG